MLRYKLTAFLAIVLLMVIPTSVMLAEDEEQKTRIGNAEIYDDISSNDAIRFTLHSLPIPVVGTTYESWLISDDAKTFLSTGVISVTADGSVSHTFNSASAGYTGTDLLQGFATAAITSETVPDDDSSQPGTVLYMHQIPADGLIHIRHLASKSPKGETGVFRNLVAQLDLAITSANAAKNATTLTEMQGHAQDVVNIIEGSSGANYKAGTVNGDGYGILNYAADRSIATTASEAVPTDPYITATSTLVKIDAKNSEDWTTLARDIALTNIIAEDELKIAQIFVGPGAGTLISNLEAARDGYDSNKNSTIEAVAGEGGAKQAIRDTQLMASFRLASVATGGISASSIPPVVRYDGSGLPITGGIPITNLLPITLLLGIISLSIGTIALRISRKNRA
jgi:hypothetical protein